MEGMTPVMAPWQVLCMILAVAAGTMLTRFAPFWLFPESRKVPVFITHLGSILPPAMMGLLVVYCLKDVKVMAAPYGLPEAGGILVTILLHVWKRNSLLSIAVGTGVYMVLLGLMG